MQCVHSWSYAQVRYVSAKNIESKKDTQKGTHRAEYVQLEGPELEPPSETVLV